MTTETKTIKGWKGMELKVNMAVQIDPAADTAVVQGHIFRIYANGEEVQVKLGSQRCRVSCKYVRPLLTSEEREHGRNVDMESLHNDLRKDLTDWLYEINHSHEKRIVEFADQKSVSQLADHLRWKAEGVMYDGAYQEAVHQFGIVKEVQKYIDGEVQLGYLAEKIVEARKYAAVRALSSPHVHNSTCAMSNFYEEIKHKMMCELGNVESYNSWTRVLHSIVRKENRLNEIIGEW